MSKSQFDYKKYRIRGESAYKVAVTMRQNQIQDRALNPLHVHWLTAMPETLAHNILTVFGNCICKNILFQFLKHSY